MIICEEKNPLPAMKYFQCVFSFEKCNNKKKLETAIIHLNGNEVKKFIFEWKRDIPLYCIKSEDSL